jgi:uncharacterized protein YndB with AHSA1/START domain
MATSPLPIRAATGRRQASRPAFDFEAASVGTRAPYIAAGLRLQAGPMRILLWTVVTAAVVAAILFVPLPWPDAVMATRIVDSVDIAAPPERVFAYVTTPANWPRWHPQSRAVSGVVDRTPQPGEKTIEDFEIAGRKGRATWTSIAVDSPRRWEFEGRSEGGGGARIVYTLSATRGGTRFERALEYRGPNLAFAIVNALRLRAVMQADSAEAVRRLKQAIEAPSRTP